jgi:hypothetical protein
MKMAGRRNIEIIQDRNEEAYRYWSRLGSDVALLESRGYSAHELDDYCFESLRKLERRSVNEQLGGFDMLRGVKKIAADTVADFFKLQPGFIRDAITNFIAGLGLSDLSAMFSPGGCKTIVTKLAAALQGAIIDNVLKQLSLQPDNFITTAVTEAIKSGFVQEGPFVKVASGVICKIKFSDLLPGGRIAAATPGAAPAAPGAAPAVAAPAAAAPAA